MKVLAGLFLFMFFLIPQGGTEATEIDSSYHHQFFRDRPKDIDPDTSAYGVKFGSTIKEVTNALGKPRGIMVINESKRALLYGNSHLFIFLKGKFRELVVSDHVLYWELSKQMEKHPFFDNHHWTLNPGIRQKMTFAQIRDLISRPKATPKYQYTFAGKDSFITLRFSHRQGETGAEAYFLHGFSIEHYGR